MQESERDIIKRRIRALSEKTVNNGCTESEAMFAFKKIGELLTQYNLTMDEVSLRQEKCVTRMFATNAKKRNIIWDCFYGLQKMCGVKTWFSRERDGLVWSFFGLESDVAMAVYLCDIMQNVETSAVATFQHSYQYRHYQGHRGVLTNNFKAGLGERINQRLCELAREREREERAAASHHAATMKARMLEATEDAVARAAEATTGTALICIAKEKMVEEEFAKRGPKLRTERSHSKARVNWDARAAGRKAGDNVNLRRPLDSDKPAGYLK